MEIKDQIFKEANIMRTKSILAQAFLFLLRSKSSSSDYFLQVWVAFPNLKCKLYPDF